MWQGAWLLACAAAAVWAAPYSTARGSEPLLFQGALLAPADATESRLRALKAGGWTCAALPLGPEPPGAGLLRAAARVRRAGLELGWWIEVGRNPVVASRHPEWIASIQGPHPEWRRRYPNAPVPGEGEVVKAWPWVPVGYKESFHAHLQRISALLGAVPPARWIFLNDLQGPPSACGCGNPLCRWTTDYGPLVSATRLGSDAAARFVVAVVRRSRFARVVPVWTTECREHQMAGNQACAGVPCYAGTCWYEWTRQLMPVAAVAPQIGALTLSRTLGQEERGRPRLEWLGESLRAFADMPPQRNGRAVETRRVLAVLQAWDANPQDLDLQIRRVRDAGAGGWLAAWTPIRQDWQPRVHQVTGRPNASTLAEP